MCASSCLLSYPLSTQAIAAPDFTSSSVTRGNREEPVSPEERRSWMGGPNSLMAGSIARFLRSTQRAVANLRSPASQAGYCELSKEGNSPLPRKQPKSIHDTPPNLKDSLERSVFGDSMSPSSSIHRPRVLSTYASMNEFVGLSANAGFLRFDDDEDIPGTWAHGASSPRSRNPPLLDNPERKKQVQDSEVHQHADAQGENVIAGPTVPFLPNARTTSPQVVIMNIGHVYTHPLQQKSDL